MGTVTKYYPFIDEDSRAILDTLIEESESYYEFTQRLGEVVLNNDVHNDLAYIAAVHTWWCRLKETMSLIQEKYRECHCIHPWGFLHDDMTQLNKVRDRCIQAINKVKETGIDEWMEVEFQVLHSYFYYPYHGDVPSLLRPLERASELIDADSNLICFDSLVCALKGWAMNLEGDVENAFRMLSKGKSIAESNDDYLYWYINAINEGAVLLYRDVPLAMERFEELYDLAQELNVPYLLSEVLNDSSMVFETAGEYDLAISSHIEVEKISGENFWTNQIRSRIYSMLGEGQKALDEINKFSHHETAPTHRIWGLRRAWALALLGRTKEAEQDLDSIKSQLLRSGSDTILGTYYHVLGVIEMARGNYLSALDFLETSWKYAEQMPRLLNRSIVLLDLAKVEYLAFKDSTEGMTKRTWLSRLERHVMEHKLPGIKMQVALLKSEFYQDQDQLKDAQAILQEALDITDSPGVGTLRKKIMKRLDELSQLISEQS